LIKSDLFLLMPLYNCCWYWSCWSWCRGMGETVCI